MRPAPRTIVRMLRSARNPVTKCCNLAGTLAGIETWGRHASSIYDDESRGDRGMKMIRTAFLAVVASACAAGLTPASAETVVVRVGRMLDVEQGVYLADRAIRIEDGRVASITPWAAGSRTGGRLIDWSAYTVLPGLIDLHTHLVGDISSADVAAPLSSSAARDALMGVAHARATLDAGFTTVRDVGTYRAFVDVALRNAINAGQVEGPRMFVAGAYVTVPGGGGEVTGLPEGTVVPDEMRRGVAANEAEVRQRVREFLAGGADLIKVIATGAVFTAGTDALEAGVHGTGDPRRRRGGREARHVRRRARPRRRGHQERDPRRRAHRRARLVPRRRGHRADGEARHLAGRRHLQRRLHRGSRHARRLARGDHAQEPRDDRHAARQLRQGGRGGRADRLRHRLRASTRTATMHASSPTWSNTA